jgi:predicted S18 family serine protease
MVRERNREIEAIINKLGDETHDTQKQLLTQYERKVKDVEAKWKSEVEEHKVTIKQWKDKVTNEENTRSMMDENLRVLSRRINEMELDIQDKKEKI